MPVVSWGGSWFVLGVSSINGDISKVRQLIVNECGIRRDFDLKMQKLRTVNCIYSNG
jgi:hypothetical protein